MKLVDRFYEILGSVYENEPDSTVCKHGRGIIGGLDACSVCIEESLEILAAEIEHRPAQVQRNVITRSALPTMCSQRDCKLTFIALAKGAGLRAVHNGQVQDFLGVQPPLDGNYHPTLATWLYQTHGGS